MEDNSATLTECMEAQVWLIQTLKIISHLKRSECDLVHVSRSLEEEKEIFKQLLRFPDDDKFDEIEAMQSIYGDAWQVQQESSACSSFQIEIKENNYLVTLYLTLPQSYPLVSPPTYNLLAPSLTTQQKNQLRAFLDDVYLNNIGQTVLYQWIEKVREFIISLSEGTVNLLETQDFTDTPEEISSCDYSSNPLCSSQSKNTKGKLQCGLKPSKSVGDSEIEIIHGEVILDRKSTFQGHLARIYSTEDVKQVLSILLENKKIAHATHNMYAYRISLPVIQDCQDDGETQAGSRMLHLLQILDVTDVLVVVSRWYGGVHLGADRFRHINNATRQVIEQAGLLKQRSNKS